MRPALHSHSLQDDVPVYNALSSEINSSGQSYPSYSPSIHNVDPANEHNLAAYRVSSPDDQQGTHAHIDHNGMHLDPSLSGEATGIGRQILPNSSPIQQHHDFSPANPTARSDSRSQNPPTPPRIPNSAPPGHFDMMAPPPSTHPSWQALHEYAQSHASAHGYALSINTTAKNRSRIKLACVCYGAPKNTHKLTPETRVRKNRVSYKTGCKMWIEGKKQEDGLWVLKVGEPMHNHPGRSIEGWAVQRKRTWGVQGGRIGFGGVTAKEEKARMENMDASQHLNNEGDEGAQDENSDPANHSLERGGLVWKIVEQEMLRKGAPGQGRDRGVGRTVKVLEERLPGIHIFKRDVYNIRAQIKRARKAAGQQLGEGLDASDGEEDEPPDEETHPHPPQHQQQQNHQAQTQHLSQQPSHVHSPG